MSQLGCHVKLHLDLGDLTTEMTVLIDSGAQIGGLLPIRLIPYIYRNNLALSRQLAGISGTTLPVAGSIIMDVTFGGLTRAVEFVILDESLDIPCGIVGIQFLVDFHVTLDCHEKCVRVHEKIVPSQFFEIPEKESKQFSCALEVKRRINRLEVTKLHAFARKFSDINKWVQAQIAHNITAPVPHYGGEDDLIHSDSLKCIRRIFKDNQINSRIIQACQTGCDNVEIGLNACNRPSQSPPRSGDISEVCSDDDSDDDSIDNQSCIEFSELDWSKLFQPNKINTLKKSRKISLATRSIRSQICVTEKDRADLPERTGEFGAELPSIEGGSIVSRDTPSRLCDLSTLGELHTRRSSASSIEIVLQPELPIDLQAVSIRSETSESRSIKQKHSQTSADYVVNLKRMRCPECHTENSSIKESTLDLSVFSIKQAVTLAPRCGTPICAYIQCSNSDIPHVDDKYFFPQQYLNGFENVIMSDTISATEFGNKHKILLVNTTEQPIAIPANEKLGMAIRLIEQKPDLPSTPSDPIKPTLNKEQRCKFLFDAIKLDHLEGEERLQMENLITEFHDIFYVEESDFKVIQDFEYTIKMKDSERCYIPQFRLRKEHTIVLQEMIDDMIKKRLVEKIDPSKDDFLYNTPLFLLKKTNDKGEATYRLLQDQRAINKRILLDSVNSYFDTIREQIYHLEGKQFFATADVKSAFHHIQLAPESRKVTAFTLNGHRYVFTILTMGSAVSPSVWITFFTTLLKSLIQGKQATVYVDDILFYAVAFAELIKILREFFLALRSKQLCITPHKCVLGVKEIQFVGYLISAAGVSVDPSRITAVLRLARPQTKTQLKSFLGSIAFYNQFIPQYSYLISQLTPLTCTGAKFVWTNETHHAWEQLKLCLAQPPILQHIKVNEELHLFTDASLKFVSGILTRLVNKIYLPVSYFSRKITLSKKFLTIQILELIAIAQSLRKFKPLITGKVYLHTDSKILCQKYNIYDNPQISRLALYIATFDVEYIHLPGTENILADYFSRAERIEKSTPHLNIPDASTRLQINALQMRVDKDIYPTPYLDPNMILSHQERDEYIVKIRQAMAEDARLLIAYKFNCDGILYVVGDADTPDRLIIPRTLANYFINLYHNCPLSPHCSAERLSYIMNRKFFLPNMRRLIEKFTAACIVCQRTKKNPHDRKSPYNALPTPADTFQHISLDICLIGRRADNSKGFIGFLTLVDGLSKYCYIRGIRTQSAEEIARHIWEFSLIHSPPETILTDHGSPFISRLFKAMCKLFNTNLTYASSYWSRGNSRAECNNKRCVLVLRTLMDRHPEAEWPDFLAPAASALNVLYNASIRNTPHFLVFLKDFRFPFENYIVEQRGPIYNYDDYVAVQKRRYYQALDAAQLYQQKMNTKNQIQYDKTTKPKQFEVNELVLCYKPTLSAALANKTVKNKYIGPYRITRRVFPHVYDIQSLVDLKTQRVNINRLKLFKGYLIFQEESDDESDQISLRELELQEESVRAEDAAAHSEPAPARGPSEARNSSDSEDSDFIFNGSDLHENMLEKLVVDKPTVNKQAVKGKKGLTKGKVKNTSKKIVPRKEQRAQRSERAPDIAVNLNRNENITDNVEETIDEQGVQGNLDSQNANEKIMETENIAENKSEANEDCNIMMEEINEALSNDSVDSLVSFGQLFSPAESSGSGKNPVVGEKTAPLVVTKSGRQVRPPDRYSPAPFK